MTRVFIPLSEIVLQLGFISPLVLFTFIPNEEEVSMTIGQFVISSLCGINPGVGNFILWSYSNQVYICNQSNLKSCLLFLRQNFSMPDPTPESIKNASVLKAALQIPARAFPLQNLNTCWLRSLSHGSA